MNKRRAVWQEQHGPIQKGWVVHNMNGDPGDNRPENLACVPRKPVTLGVLIAPYRERIRQLELRLQEGKRNGS